MRQCMDAENLHRRLAKILGHIQAIDRMVDEDVPCEDILSQITAAKSALHNISNTVYVMGLKTEIQRKPSKVLRRQWNGSPI